MGFEFEKTPQIEIRGKLYDCDPSNNDLLKGLSEGWPKVQQASQEVMRMVTGVGNNKPDVHHSRTATQKMLQANDALLVACRDFIIGTLGEAEYAEIFADHKPNTTHHMNLCVYIYAFILGGRQAVLQEFRAAVEEDLKPNDFETTAQPDTGQDSANELSVVAAKRGTRFGFFSFWRRKN